MFRQICLLHFLVKFIIIYIKITERSGFGFADSRLLICMFSINEIVSYGSTGICKIEDIRSEKLNGHNASYYILKPVYSPDSTVYLPIDNEALTSKMRYILTKQDVDSLIKRINKNSIDWIDNDQQRAETFGKIISSGIHNDILLLIKCLYNKKISLQNSNKKFHAADEKMLCAAEKIINEEFAYVLNIEPKDVNNYISCHVDA